MNVHVVNTLNALSDKLHTKPLPASHVILGSRDECLGGYSPHYLY